MNGVFLKILNMSLSAGWIVLAVLLLRAVLKKAPKWVNVVLWGIVALRLLLPFSLESALSLIPSAETVPPDIERAAVPAIRSGIEAVNSAVNPMLARSNTPTVGASADPLQIVVTAAAAVWVAGMAILSAYAVLSYLRLRRSVRTAIPLSEGIYQSERVSMPFVLGVVKPRIYLPFGMNAEALTHVIAHERAHIRRKDHLWKPLGFLLLTLHWFNPLLWLAYVLLCRDIELACDERVIRELKCEQRAAYSQALLDCAVKRRTIAACPLAFGEVGIKQRVRSVLHYKKPAFWVVAMAVAVCIAAAVCFLTNPANAIRNPAVQEYVPGAPGILGTVDKEKFEGVSEDFAIGADAYGRAVFKDPYQAFDTMVELYAEGLALIRQENDLRPISRRDYSAYQTFGWQMTAGTEEVQKQAAFITKFLDIYENSFEKEPPVPNTEIPTTEPTPEVQEWLDYLYSESLPWSGSREIALDAFPDAVFRWTPERVEAIAGGEVTGLYIGMPIWSVYFADLTGDGLPELCSTVSMGSGIIDSRIVVYDYANRVSYRLEDRARYDYSLFVQDGALCATKRAFRADHSGESIETGRLTCSDGALQIVPSASAPAKTDPVTAYVSARCIYLHPRNAPVSASGDSGCSYLIGENRFEIHGRSEASFAPAAWDYTVFTQSDWTSWFGTSDAAVPDIGGYGKKIYFDLDDTWRVLNMDGELWLMERRRSDEMGDLVWSVYALIPGSDLSYTFEPAWIDGTAQETALFAEALNRETMTVSSVQHLPIFRCETAAELARFCESYGGEAPDALAEDCKAYGDGFFSAHTLLLIYVPASSSVLRFEVARVSARGESVTVFVERQNEPERYPYAPGGRLLCVGVRREAMRGCKAWDAVMDE